MFVSDTTPMYVRKPKTEERKIVCENCQTTYSATFVDGIYRGITSYKNGEKCCSGNHQVCSVVCKKELEGDLSGYQPLGEIVDSSKDF